MTFGILTLATLDDYKKAIGLALSVRVSNPGVPIAVACAKRVMPLVAPYFDHLIEEDTALRGFAHKLHLDLYSPFDETFFFDSDVFVFRPLSEVLDQWRPHAYTACGNYIATGTSPFGLDRDRVLTLINRKLLVHIDGAGHCYFRKSECTPLFSLAREIAANFSHYAGDIMLSDEDVMDIAMTIQGLKPMPHSDFWSRYLTGKSSTVQMDASCGLCKFEVATTGEVQRPYMMHFAANEAPFVYTSQLRKLFKKYGVSTRGLRQLALHDFYLGSIRLPARRLMRRGPTFIRGSVISAAELDSTITDGNRKH